VPPSVSQPPPPPQPSPPQPHAAAAAWQLGMWVELGRVDERVLQDGEWQQQLWAAEAADRGGAP